MCKVRKKVADKDEKPKKRMQNNVQSNMVSGKCAEWGRGFRIKWKGRNIWQNKIIMEKETLEYCTKQKYVAKQVFLECKAAKLF